MLKKQMENLMAGQVVLDTRNNVELEIVGVGETKVILINGKEYSKSTLKRYFKEEDHIRLQPENDTMAPIILPNCTILGKAIGLYRKIN